jgi:hypothetical protein
MPVTIIGIIHVHQFLQEKHSVVTTEIWVYCTESNQTTEKKMKSCFATE